MKGIAPGVFLSELTKKTLNSDEVEMMAKGVLPAGRAAFMMFFFTVQQMGSTAVHLHLRDVVPMIKSYREVSWRPILQLGDPRNPTSR